MIRNKFYCKCGNVVGEYQIKDGLGGIGVNITNCCCNYCSVCGAKVDKEKFKEILDIDVKRCMTNKEEEKMLKSLIKGVRR